MSKFAIIAVATTYTFKNTEAESVTSVEAILSALNLRSIAPLRVFTFESVEYQPFYLIVENAGVLNALQAIFDAPAPALPDGFIIAVNNFDGSQDLNYPINKPAYLEAMEDDVDVNEVRTRPIAVRPLIVPHGWTVPDLS